MFSLKDMLSRLTDAYAKDPNSNIGKLFSILHAQMGDANDALQEISLRRDIYYANGETLDRIGSNVGQPRGAATDEIYRVLILSKIARNNSKSDTNTIIEVLSLALNMDASEIKILPKWNDPEEPEAAAIRLVQIPVRRLNEVGMSARQFAQIIQQTVAAGVRVAEIELSGTFAFSSDPNKTESGSAFGFSNNEMTTGGYLGDLFEPADNYELPI